MKFPALPTLVLFHQRASGQLVGDRDVCRVVSCRVVVNDVLHGTGSVNAADFLERMTDRNTAVRGELVF